jgi:hypothetical protein
MLETHERAKTLVRRTAAVLASFAGACGPPPYQPPALPPDQVAIVTVESRASIETIDGLPRGLHRYNEMDRFQVAPGCHDLTAHYEESYTNTHGAEFVLLFSPALGAAALAANTEVHDYESNMPIRFHVPAKAGMSYWVTSSFNGDQFMPRVAVLDAAGERVAVILPGQPCPGP